MNISKINNLLNAFSDKGLKVKPLSGDSYVQLSNFKRALYRAQEKHTDDIKDLGKDYKGRVEVVEVDENRQRFYGIEWSESEGNKIKKLVDVPVDFQEKLSAINDFDHAVPDINLPAVEVQGYLSEADPSNELILASILMK